MRAVLLPVALLLAACTAEPAPQGHPALWRVTGPDGARAHVFGTIHALPDKLAWDSAALDAAIAGSDSLVLEIAGDGDPALARRTFLALGATPGQPPLEDRVAPRWRRQLRRALAESKLDPAQFLGLEDWAAALTLSLALEAGDGFDSANGADQALLAKAGRRPVIGLETVAGQLGAFDSLPAAAQRRLLEAVVEESADPDDGRRLVRAWAGGDMAALDREAHGGMLADPRLRDALLVERNRAWAEKVAALLHGGKRPFVAVGAAHVAGVDGLPALLAAKGFAVKRVQ